MAEAGVWLEMERAPCARLFESRSTIALKFLAAINQGLIAALRRADRRLLHTAPDTGPAPGPVSDGPSDRLTIPVSPPST
jgi:hypothetical protein